MNGFDPWEHAVEYSIAQAVLIVTGRHPKNISRFSSRCFDGAIPDFASAKTAMCEAIRSGTLKPVKIVYVKSRFGISNDLDIFETYASALELNRFWKARGVASGYFDRPEIEEEGFEGEGMWAFDAAHPYFPKKLDAANKAWAAVTSDPALLVGKSPKQALKKWLTENAAALGLLNRDGKLNQTGIDEICKVANWKPEGGATPTRSE